MRRSAGSAEARCVGWGLGPLMWAAQAAGMASTSRVISCCWAGCAAPDLRRPLLVMIGGMKGSYCGAAHSTDPLTTFSGMWGEVLCREGTREKHCHTGPYLKALACYQL